MAAEAAEKPLEPGAAPPTKAPVAKRVRKVMAASPEAGKAGGKGE